jgi:hypothetical protein
MNGARPVFDLRLVQGTLAVHTVLASWVAGAGSCFTCSVALW